jgi:hypothetical protein
MLQFCVLKASSAPYEIMELRNTIKVNVKMYKY